MLARQPARAGANRVDHISRLFSDRPGHQPSELCGATPERVCWRYVRLWTIEPRQHANAARLRPLREAEVVQHSHAGGAQLSIGARSASKHALESRHIA